MRSGRRRVSSRRDSWQGQYSPGEKGIIHHTRKGRARDASIEIAICSADNHVTTLPRCISIPTLTITHGVYFYNTGHINTIFWQITRVQLIVASCRIKSLNGRWEQRELGQGSQRGINIQYESFGGDILYFILCDCHGVLLSPARRSGTIYAKEICSGRIRNVTNKSTPPFSISISHSGNYSPCDRRAITNITPTLIPVTCVILLASTKLVAFVKNINCQ